MSDKQIEWLNGFIWGACSMIVFYFWFLPWLAHAQTNPLDQCNQLYRGCRNTIIDQQEKYNWCLIKRSNARSIIIPETRNSAPPFYDLKTCNNEYAKCIYSALLWGGQVNGCMDKLKK